MTGDPSPPALRRGSRILGWLTFAGFELAVFVLVWIAASIRCCAANPGASPQSASEWVALGILAAMMLLLGAAVGLGAAFGAEALLRLAGKVRRRGGSGS